jgi:Holliday junction resolvasome RuvABC endonuclease subunit
LVSVFMGIPPLRILAIDPALANVGWMVLEFDPNQIEVISGPVARWIAEKDGTGLHSYHCFTRVAGGVLSTDNRATIRERLMEQIDGIHILVSLHQPDLLAFESQFEAGKRGFTGGVAVELGLVFPYFNTKERPVRLFRCPDFEYLDNPQKSVFRQMDHIPLYGVSIRPIQLQSLAHHEKTTRDKTVIQRYREITNTQYKITPHECDAYFIGVHLGRFWACCLEGCWSEDILTRKERHTFLNPETGMLNRRFECWWANF